MPDWLKFLNAETMAGVLVLIYCLQCYLIKKIPGRITIYYEKNSRGFQIILWLLTIMSILFIVFGLLHAFNIFNIENYVH